MDDETTQLTTQPGDEHAPTRALVPAGPGRHWQTIADYLNEDEDDEGAVRVTGEPVTLAAPDVVDADARDVTPATKPGPVPLAPVGPFRDNVRRAYVRAASLPTPGDLGPLLFALIVFGMAIIPVGPNGETRLQLLWGTVTGSVTIPTKGATDAQGYAAVAAQIDPWGNVPIVGGVINGITGIIAGGLHQVGVGAGPDGMPGYTASGGADDLGAYGGGMYERLY